MIVSISKLMALCCLVFFLRITCSYSTSQESLNNIQNCVILSLNDTSNSFNLFECIYCGTAYFNNKRRLGMRKKLSENFPTKINYLKFSWKRQFGRV